MKTHHFVFALFTLLFFEKTAGQVPFLTFSVNAHGQAEIEVASDEAHYYVLHVRHEPVGNFHATALFLGKNGTTTLSEPLAAYPTDHYKISEHLILAPVDTDSDGRDDLEEFNDLVSKSPFNSAAPIDPAKGVAFIRDRAGFEALSYKNVAGFNLPDLQGLEVVKFYILDKDSGYPQLYFLNNSFDTHTQFAQAIGVAGNPTLMTGLLVFHPNLVAADGSLGVYRFNFQPHNLHSFLYVQKTAELLAANMPFLHNNLCYYPYPQTSLPLYFLEKNQFDASRVCLVFDDDIYVNTDYIGFHLAEGFGLLRKMTLAETPGPRDIVIYETLPNSLPRVGGIITTVTQTPLSHVNLRAIQDDLPNSFVRDALQKPEIDALLGKYVFYKTEKDTFQIREAAQKEVDDFYESRRPTAPIVPVRDLSQTKIKPLDSILFENSASFGAKCANVATMRTFGFPDWTVPDGFGVPFFFYDEFMKFNGFYAQAADMMAQPIFQNDQSAQQQMLDDFRKKIRAGAMPNWMLADLATMQAAFPPGQPIRCRSSTNNEDLPGFSGAGLYDSYTHKPSEGHISKTIRQVFASMWNYRAFDEREFYRVDHGKAAMGILVHPNSENELANGVGVSIDPVYRSEGTFYFNTQLGENLVTNPTALSIAEEILLEKMPSAGPGFAVMQPSNQVPADSLIFKMEYLDEMRGYFSTIHDRFKILYKAEKADGFAMEIEYKIEENGQLRIKQARPWADFWAKFEQPPSLTDSTEIAVWPNPFADFLTISAEKNAVLSLRVFNVEGKSMLSQKLVFENEPLEIPVGWLPGGAYFIEVFDEKKGLHVTRVLVKF